MSCLEVVHLCQYQRKRGEMHAQLNVTTQHGWQHFGLQAILTPLDTKPLKFESGKIRFSSIGQLWVSTDVRKMTTISFLLSLLYQYHHPHSSSVTLDYILIPVFYGFAWSNSTSHVRINVSFAHFSHNYFCTFLLQCFEAMALGHPPAGLL